MELTPIPNLPEALMSTNLECKSSNRREVSEALFLSIVPGF